MKIPYVILIICSHLSLGPLFAQDTQKKTNALEVHEWGTFTTLCGSSGVELPGLYIDEEKLPAFTHNISGTNNPDLTKGFSDNLLKNVTVKMETPVLYFYSQEEQSVNVKVHFPKGSISQWYPQRDGGEENLHPLTTIDFSNPKNGWIEWNATVLAPTNTQTYTNSKDLETHTWVAPRATASNMIRGTSGEIEKFLFYRGIGNFELPINIEFNTSKKLVITNKGPERIPFVMVYEKKADGRKFIWWKGSLESNNVKVVPPAFNFKETEVLMETVKKQLELPLVNEGLFQDEALAMINTWEQSYFETPGIKVFWILPQQLVNELLPLQITPVPSSLKRVIVGRNEILSLDFETRLYKDYKEAGASWSQWSGDRYIKAFEARMKELEEGRFVQLTDINHDVTTSSIQPIASSDNSLIVFPNPASDIISIHTTCMGASPIELTIMNLLGKKVIEKTLVQNSFGEVNESLSVNSLANGVYIIKCQTSNKNTSIKFIKE